MISRRSGAGSGVATGFGAAAKGIGDVINELLKARINSGAVDHSNELIAQRQTDLANLNHRNEMQQKLFDAGIKGQEGDQTGFEKLGTSVGAAKSLDELPTPTSLVQQGKNFGQSDPYFAGPFPNIKLPDGTMSGEIVAHPDRPVDQRTPIEDLLSADASKKAALDQQVQDAENAKPRLGPNGVTGFIGRNNLFTPTERTGAQEGNRKVQTDQAELDPAFVSMKAEADSQMERLTRGEKVKTAGGIAGAQAQAQQSVLDNPTNIAGAANRAGAISGATAKGATSPSTARTVANIPSMVNANVKLNELEKQGASASAMAQYEQGGPIGSAILPHIAPALGQEKPINRQYVQAGKDFVGFVVLALSGQQASETEAQRIFNTYTALEGDTPAVRAQKKASRAIMLGAAMNTAGKSQFEIGQGLGRAMDDGSLTEDTLTSMKFPPEMVRGIVDTYKPAIKGGGQ